MPEAEAAAARKVLAVASGGGHWVQLRRLREAFEGHDVVFVTVDRAFRADVGDADFRVVNDATRWNKVALVLLALRMLWIVWREGPDVIVSTGAAPGYLAIRIGRWLGARTVWIDSIANVEEISYSGELVGPHADLWLTQWSHLARDAGPRYEGAVL